MKKLLLVTLFIFNFCALAGVKDWSIVENEGQYWLQYKDQKNLKALITKRTGESKVIKTIDVGSNYEVIVYYSGVAGTFNIVEVSYAVIFDKKARQFIGDYPWAYKSQTNAKKPMPNPKWNITEKSIIITDEQTDLNKTVELLSN